jgi:hypothetical protein
MTDLPQIPGSIGRFIAECLEPPKGGIPHDKGYNRASRKAREAIFDEAYDKMIVARAAHDFFLALRFHTPDDHRQDAIAVIRIHLLDLWRQSSADRIRSPAYSRKSLSQKRRLLKSRQFQYFSISKFEAEACIGADEMFLDAHPVVRPRRKLLMNS